LLTQSLLMQQQYLQQFSTDDSQNTNATLLVLTSKPRLLIWNDSMQYTMIESASIAMVDDDDSSNGNNQPWCCWKDN
jgi:hypothetical protein